LHLHVEDPIHSPYSNMESIYLFFLFLPDVSSIPLSTLPSITFPFFSFDIGCAFFLSFPGLCVCMYGWLYTYFYLYTTTTFSFLITFFSIFFAALKFVTARRIVREKQHKKFKRFYFFFFFHTAIRHSLDRFFRMCFNWFGENNKSAVGYIFLFFWETYKIRYFLRGRDRMMVRIFSSTQRLDVFFFSSSDEFPKGRATTTIQRYVMERDTPHLIPCRMRPLQRRVCV
jgi:hypothetical protein